MKFKDENEKRKFAESLLSKGIEAAKQDHLKATQGIFIVEKGKTLDLFDESLTANEIRKKYPETLVIELTKEETDV